MIGNKAYVGTGTDDIVFFKNFWEYDQPSDTWTGKANFPGAARREAVAFSIGTDGFVGTGCCGAMSDFWKYNSLTDTWTSITPYPGGPTMTGIAFSIGTKGYVGLGDDGGASFSQKIFEYDPATDTWTQKANFPGAGRTDALGFAMNGKGYVAIGDDGTLPMLNDIWEYDPVTDTWTQKTDFPGGPRTTAAGFAIASTGKLYIGTGDDDINQYDDFWEWNSTDDTWTQVMNFGGGIRTDETGFAIGSKGYIALGQIGAPPEFNDLWEYSALVGIKENYSANTISIYPNPSKESLQLTAGNLQKETGVEILDVIGRVILKSQILNPQSQISIDISALSHGMYYLKVANGAEQAQTRFVKE